MIAALLFLAQVSNTQQINLQCECHCAPCLWTCHTEQVLLDEAHAMIDEMTTQVQQLQAALVRSSGFPTMMPAWCLSFGSSCDANGDGRVDLEEFQQVQQRGAWQ